MKKSYILLALLLFFPIAFSQCVNLNVTTSLSGNVSLCQGTYNLTQAIQITGDTVLNLNGSTIIASYYRIFNGTGNCYKLEVYNGTFDISYDTTFYYVDDPYWQYCFADAKNLTINVGSWRYFHFAGNLSESKVFLGTKVNYGNFYIYDGYLYNTQYTANLINDEFHYGYLGLNVIGVYNSSFYDTNTFESPRSDQLIKDSYIQSDDCHLNYLTSSGSIFNCSSLQPPNWFKLNNTNITYSYIILNYYLESDVWKESYCNNCYINGKPVFYGIYSGENLADYSWVYITGFNAPYNLTLYGDYALIENYDYDINIDASASKYLLIDSNRNINIDGNYDLSLSVFGGNVKVNNVDRVYNLGNVEITGDCHEIRTSGYGNTTRYGNLYYYSGNDHSRLNLYNGKIYGSFYFNQYSIGYFENVSLMDYNSLELSINDNSNFTCINCDFTPSPGYYSNIYVVIYPSKYIYLDAKDISYISLSWWSPYGNITIVGDNSFRYYSYQTKYNIGNESPYFDHYLEVLIRTYISKNFTSYNEFGYTINRTIYNANKSLVMFVEDLISWWNNLPNQTYVIGNLYPNTRYNLYINGNYITTLQTDSNGYTPPFEVQFHSPANITLEQAGYPPTAIIISPQNTTYQTYVAPVIIEGRVLVYGSDSTYNVTFYLDNNTIAEFINVSNNTEVVSNFSASEGTHTFKVVVIGNDYGYSSENSTVFTVQVIPAYPTIIITSPQNTTYLTNVDSRLVDFEFRVYGYDNSYNVTAYLDNSPIYLNSNFANDSTYYTSLDVDVGTHEFRVEAIGNDYGYSSEESVIFTVERVYGPYVQIISPANQTYCSGNINLEYVVTDTYIDKCWYSIDDGNNISLPNCENTTLTLGEGNHKVIVYANNTLGDVGYDVVYFKVDLNPPIITIISPENETYTGRGTIELRTSVSDVSSTTCYYELDGNTSSYDCNSALITVTEGSHYLKACAQDECGRVSCDEVYFTYQYPKVPAILSLYKNLILLVFVAGVVYLVLRSGLSPSQMITIIIAVAAIALALIGLVSY
ncbi:hypothetical protein DRN69_00220 [Candidatus Pacearchaeota archaeon]|nr:MAG: hypothetical protein DRN69_00220 [Candidatus Pacearchaeota archaeon]